MNSVGGKLVVYAELSSLYWPCHLEGKAVECHDQLQDDLELP